MNGIRIEGDRVVLREWRSDDHEAIYRLMGDAEVVRYLSWRRLTPAQCIQRLNDFIFDQHCRASKEPLGWLGNTAPAKALQRRIVSVVAKRPIECNGEPDCRRYRYYFALELKPSNRVIGEAGFEWSSKDRAARHAEVGYFIEREFWGQGYATDAALLAINFAFTTLNANNVSAVCDPRNHASERVMQKCGLREAARDLQGSVIRTLSRSLWLESHSLRSGMAS
jgi:RimJ/RimL family protein N-acetyltransferase